MSEYRRYYIKGEPGFHGKFTESSKPTFDHPVSDAP